MNSCWRIVGRQKAAFCSHARTNELESQLPTLQPDWSLSEPTSKDAPCSTRRRSWRRFEPSVGITIQFAASHQPVDFRPDFTQIVKIEIDTGEPDIGHLIDIGQLIEHEIADHFACDLGAPQALNLVLDVVGNALHALAADGPFDRGDADAGKQFLRIEGFAVAVPFGDEQGGRNMLIGSEALLAIQAFTAAADRLPSISRIDYLVFAMSAMGALHHPSLYRSA